MRAGICRLILSLSLICLLDRPEARAEISSNEVVRLVAECRQFSSFLCQKPNDNDLVRAIRNGEIYRSRDGRNLISIETSFSSFILDSDLGTVSSFTVKPLVGSVNLQDCIKPSADMIRQHTCSNIQFTSPNIWSSGRIVHYQWTRKEADVLIEAETLDVAIDPTGTCVGFRNSVHNQSIDIRVPEDFDAKDWIERVKKHVNADWNRLALYALGVDPFEYKPELVNGSYQLYYTKENRLICRFPFKASSASARSTEPASLEFFVDFDVATHQVIAPKPNAVH